MKKLVALLFIASAFTFTGCGGADSNPTEPEEFSSAPVGDLEGASAADMKKAREAAKDKVGKPEGGMR